MEKTNKIINMLSDRGGFDGWWGNIDDDIQDEIKGEIESIINEPEPKKKKKKREKKYQMSEEKIIEALDEIMEEDEPETFEGAVDILMEHWLRDMFELNNWDETDIPHREFTYNGKRYMVKIQEDGCCEATNEHRIMYFKHTLNELL